MSIGVTQVYSAAENTTTTAATEDTLGKDAFLQMLVAQLQNQDPLNPMDGTEYTAQLAQFSSLEQLQNINDVLAELTTAQNAAANYEAVQYIGKTVNALGDNLMIQDGTVDPVQFSLADDSAQVYINIYDANGDLVKSVELGPMEAGIGEYEWDGTDNDGNQLADGTYSYELSAVNSAGEAVDTYSFVTAKVTGVAFENGVAYLLAGDRTIPLSDVIRVVADA